MKLELNGNTIKIRKLKFSDAMDIYKNVKDKEVIKWTLSIPYPYPKDGAIKFIRKSHYKIKKKKSYDFGVVFKKTNRVIGIVSFNHVDWENKNAELGCWLGKKYWRQGLMTEAVKLILKFGFKKLKLHRIFAGLFEGNIASKKLLEKCGFKLEGKIRETRYRRKKWHNELTFGILRSEFRE